MVSASEVRKRDMLEATSITGGPVSWNRVTRVSGPGESGYVRIDLDDGCHVSARPETLVRIRKLRAVGGDE